MTDVFDTSRPESDVSPPLRTARRTARLCRSGHHHHHCHSPLLQHAAFATARCPPSHSVGTASSRQHMGGYGGPGGPVQGRSREEEDAKDLAPRRLRARAPRVARRRRRYAGIGKGWHGLPGPARGRALLISARPTTLARTPSLLAARGRRSWAQLNRGQYR